MFQAVCKTVFVPLVRFPGAHGLFHFHCEHVRPLSFPGAVVQPPHIRCNKRCVQGAPGRQRSFLLARPLCDVRVFVPALSLSCSQEPFPHARCPLQCLLRFARIGPFSPVHFRYIQACPRCPERQMASYPSQIICKSRFRMSLAEAARSTVTKRILCPCSVTYSSMVSPTEGCSKIPSAVSYRAPLPSWERK